LLGEIINNIEYSLVLVIGDATVIQQWDPDDDAGELIDALTPETGAAKSGVTIEVDGKPALGLGLFDGECDGTALVFGVAERLVFVQGKIDAPDDASFLAWVARAPAPKARKVCTLALKTNVLAVLGFLEPGASVKKSLRKLPALGKTKTFGDDIDSLLVGIEAGSYVALVDKQVDEPWGEAQRCTLQRAETPRPR
jgi:hypothetical protein